MPNLGIQNFYYTKQLVQRAVEIAQVSTAPTTPATLTDINNTVYGAGSLSITPSPSGSPFIPAAIGQSVEISGAIIYLIYNKFFEITDQATNAGHPMYYTHGLPAGTTNVAILGVDGNVVTGLDYVVNTVTRGTTSSLCLLHSFDGIFYQVRYIDGQGYLHTEMLKYAPVMTRNQFGAAYGQYFVSERFFEVNSTGNFYVRFTQQSGYQVLPPYGTTPNDPWFLRVRFNMTPPAPEWSAQVFLPQLPYMLATWVPGVVLNSNVIEFERKKMFYSQATKPDILVYDKNYNIKYAIAGSDRHGYLFNWRVNLIQDVDYATARVQVSVPLESTDIIFGFYSYDEEDVIFRTLDVNPYTNPAVRNRVINLYMKTDGVDPFHYIYYKILNEDGSTYSTNDTSTTTGTNHPFATVVVGASVGTADFTITDARARGGGLAPQYQESVPQSANFWDLGYWDGKPFPIGGSLIVYLPVSLQETFTKDQINSHVQAILPMGAMAVIRYYDSNGNETV